jgi:tRNA (cmo5U34)-methyltransferase
MDTIRKHFEDEAREFDRIIVTLIPGYARMVEALVVAIPFESSAPVRVIDLGCGTGTVAERVLRSFPNAQVTCLDSAENMITMARAKLGDYPHVHYVAGDFNSFDLDGKYDVVVSSLALHHLVTNDDKRQFYRRIYGSLRPGEFFITQMLFWAQLAFYKLRICNSGAHLCAATCPRTKSKASGFPSTRPKIVLQN